MRQDEKNNMKVVAKTVFTLLVIIGSIIVISGAFEPSASKSKKDMDWKEGFLTADEMSINQGIELLEKVDFAHPDAEMINKAHICFLYDVVDYSIINRRHFTSEMTIEAREAEKQRYPYKYQLLCTARLMKNISKAGSLRQAIFADSYDSEHFYKYVPEDYTGPCEAKIRNLRKEFGVLYQELLPEIEEQRRVQEQERIQRQQSTYHKGNGHHRGCDYGYQAGFDDGIEEADDINRDNARREKRAMEKELREQVRNYERFEHYRRYRGMN